MLRAKNIMCQSVAGVQFGTDVRNGRIEYASFGGDDQRTIDVLKDQSLTEMVLWAICVACRKLGVFGLKTCNFANEQIVGYVEKHVRVAAASLGMIAPQKGYNPAHFLQDCVSAIWEDLGKFRPTKRKSWLGAVIERPGIANFGTWIYWRVKHHKKLWYARQESKKRREKDLDVLIGKVPMKRTVEYRSLDQLGENTPRCSLDQKDRVDSLKSKFSEKDWEVLNDFYVKGLTLKDIAAKTEMTSMGVQKRIKRLVNSVRPADQPIVNLGGRRQRETMILKMNQRQSPPHEEGVLRVVDAPCSGYRHNGHQVFMPDRPNERLQSSLGATISPNFADYVRKVRGNGFVMLVAD